MIGISDQVFSFGYATKDFGFDNIIFEDQINIYQNIISLSTYDPIALGRKYWVC